MRKRSVVLHEMTRSDFEEYLAATKIPVALIPVGAVEQHGPHLPLGMDALAGLEYCKLVAERADCVVVQSCLPGYSPHHMGFGGTITYREDTLISVLYDTIESLAHHGIRRILLLNTHGGNREIVNYVARMASRRYDCAVLAWVSGPVLDPKAAMREEIAKLDWHSGKRETGKALALFPELVDLEQVEALEPTARWRNEALVELADPERDDILLAAIVVRAYIGDTHEFTSSGVYGWTNPRDADPEEAKKQIQEGTEMVVHLIDLWRTVEEPPRDSSVAEGGDGAKRGQGT